MSVSIYGVIKGKAQLSVLDG